MRALTGMVAVAVLGLGGVANAELVVDQIAHADLGYWSDGQAGQFYNQRIGDDFTLGSATTVTDISWVGHSENWFSGDLANVLMFHIEIFEDNGFGAPGASVYSTDVSVGVTNAVALDINGGTTSTNFRHTASVGALNLDAGNYFLSIGAKNSDPDGDGWAWNTASGTHNSMAIWQDGYGSSWADFAGTDMAFSINAVPAPGALALLGAAGLLGSRRRRRNNA